MDSPEHITEQITSIGWVFHQNKDEVTITTCLAGDRRVNSALTIPRKAIISMNKLKHYVEEEK